MKSSEHHVRGQTGLTLAELMVAMAVAGILLAAGYGVFLTQQKTYAVQDRVAKLQQNARAAMNLITRDLRMAGHGLPTWSVQIGGKTYSKAVTAMGDTLMILGCFGAPASYLSASVDSGETRIRLVDPGRFNTGDRKYIFIGEYDKAVIRDIVGNRLDLEHPLKKRYPTTRLAAAANPGDSQISVQDTAHILAGDILPLGDERLYVSGVGGNVITFGNPLKFEYTSQTRFNPVPVFFVQALRYTLDRDGRIKREDLSGGGKQTLAENIEALTFSEVSHGVYQIALSARANVPDDDGRFRSRTYDFRVRVRNPL